MWLVLWLIFVALAVGAPVAYGTGVRRWGPPYPTRFYRYKRPPGTVPADGLDDRWGRTGDLIWIAIGISIIWLAIALL